VHPFIFAKLFSECIGIGFEFLLQFFQLLFPSGQFVTRRREESGRTHLEMLKAHREEIQGGA
jgi:hypothetical protein